jgi:hypothetical protein
MGVLNRFFGRSKTQKVSTVKYTENKKTEYLTLQLLRKRITCGQKLDDLELELANEYARLYRDGGMTETEATERAIERINEIRRRQSVQAEGEYGENLKSRIRTRKGKTGNEESYVKPPSKLKLMRKRIGLIQENTRTDFQKAEEYLDAILKTTDSAMKAALINNIKKLLERKKMSKEHIEIVTNKLKEIETAAAAAPPPPPSPSPPPPPPPANNAAKRKTAQDAAKKDATAARKAATEAQGFSKAANTAKDKAQPSASNAASKELQELQQTAAAAAAAAADAATAADTAATQAEAAAQEAERAVTLADAEAAAAKAKTARGAVNTARNDAEAQAAEAEEAEAAVNAIRKKQEPGPTTASAAPPQAGGRRKRRTRRKRSSRNA